MCFLFTVLKEVFFLEAREQMLPKLFVRISVAEYGCQISLFVRI